MQYLHRFLIVGPVFKQSCLSTKIMSGLNRTLMLPAHLSEACSLISFLIKNTMDIPYFAMFQSHTYLALSTPTIFTKTIDPCQLGCWVSTSRIKTATACS